MNAFRLVLLSFLIACIFGAGLSLGSFFWKKPPVPPPQIQNTAVVLRQVQGLSELVTVKYVLEKVVILEDVKWYGDSRVMLVAHGVVKAGVSLKDLKAENVRIKQKKITVQLPGAVIFDAYLDEKRTQIVERNTGLLRSYDKDMEQNARRQAVGAISSAAREIGIVKEAEERARHQLKDLFLKMGFEEVEFRTP